MTILIATITAERAVISQDTLLLDGSKAPYLLNRKEPLIGDLDSAARFMFAGDGTPPESGHHSGFIDKIAVLPRLHMAIGCSGDMSLSMYWAAAVRAELRASNVIEVECLAAEIWERVPAEAKSGRALCAIHAGWSPLHGCAKAFLYSTDNGFSSQPLPAGAGHTIDPLPPFDDDPEWARISDLWTPAAYGERTEEFHVAVAQAQHRTFCRGLYRKGFAYGGQLHTAIVDRSGVAIRVAHEFADYAAQLGKLYDLPAGDGR